MSKNQKYIEHPKADFKMRGEYINDCECGRSHTLFTQEDDSPEYYTTVSLKCECGNLIKFLLPVN